MPPWRTRKLPPDLWDDLLLTAACFVAAPLAAGVALGSLLNDALTWRDHRRAARKSPPATSSTAPRGILRG
jgi:hypothetical protein